MPDNFSPSLRDLAGRLFGEPNISPQLHEALAAVRQQGAYYGGWPQVPGPSVRLPPSLKSEPPAIGWNSIEQMLRSGPPRAAMNENAPRVPIWERFPGLFSNPTERERLLSKLIANRDFRPSLHNGKLWWRSLSPAENEAMQRIGWARAPDVEYEQEMSDDPLTSLRAWERNIRHWHELAAPPRE
jgi:hypothetical protein